MRFTLLLALVSVSIGCSGTFRDALGAGSRVSRAQAPVVVLDAAVAALPAATVPSTAWILADHAARERHSLGTRVERAGEVLVRHVRRQSHPEALRSAFRAYYSFSSARPELVRKPYLYYVDFGLDSRTPRGYVFDMVALAVVDGPFHVAHGRGSAPRSEATPTTFSNRNGSYMTSLGLYLAEETYDFNGSSAGSHYRSVGLRMAGLSGTFNDQARERGIVAHGAPYVTPGQAGRSEGCPAMEESRARHLLPMLANGSLVFLFSPADPVWLHQDPWAARAAVPPTMLAMP